MGSPSTTAPVPGHSRHRLAPGAHFDIAAHDTKDTGGLTSEEEAQAELERLRERISDVADRFAAEASHALLIVLQGFDGAGKDEVIAQVMSAIEPSGLHVFDFNTPVGSEVDHDFLWRFHHQTPPRGTVHVFDRSHYEEVISARVHDIVDAESCRARCESINDCERILARDGTVILKFFLHVSKDVQAERIRERLCRRSKQWKFSAADVQDRALWDDYDRAYEDAISATGQEHAPWHAVPADHRWYAVVAVAEALLSTLEGLDPQYPPIDEDELREAGIDPSEVTA
jgi:PPK2 family polyphosphate:nucleotide phosphotransferase